MLPVSGNFVIFFSSANRPVLSTSHFYWQTFFPVSFYAPACLKMSSIPRLSDSRYDCETTRRALKRRSIDRIREMHFDKNFERKYFENTKDFRAITRGIFRGEARCVHFLVCFVSPLFILPALCLVHLPIGRQTEERSKRENKDGVKNRNTTLN